MKRIDKALYDQKVDEIFENFDFEKVFDVMCHLKWTWKNKGIPSVYEMKKQAKEYFEECLSCLLTGEPCNIGANGFMYSAELIAGEPFLSMEFILTSSEC